MHKFINSTNADSANVKIYSTDHPQKNVSGPTPPERSVLVHCMTLLVKTWLFYHLNSTRSLWHFYYVLLMGDGLGSNPHSSRVKKWEEYNKTKFLRDSHELLAASNIGSSE